MALKNSMVASGGTSAHVERRCMAAAAARGCAFVNVSPLRDDLPEEARPEWLAPVPNTDTAMMLGMAHTLLTEGLHDAGFIARFCSGWDIFEDYLTGRGDGVPKTAAWAAEICGLPAETIAGLARRMAGRRSLIVMAHSLQRAEHGEQPVWMAGVLAALLGQIGLPGGG
jgi:biotin/methionine sulfoxide reductase